MADEMILTNGGKILILEELCRQLTEENIKLNKALRKCSPWNIVDSEYLEATCEFCECRNDLDDKKHEPNCEYVILTEGNKK